MGLFGWPANSIATDSGSQQPPSSDGDLKKIRVCHIVATTAGAVWVFEQLRDLRDRYGYDVTVILSGDSGPLVDRFNSAGIRVLSADFSFFGVGDFVKLPKKIWALAEILKRERFDVVQSHLFHSMVIGRVAAWLADVPVRLAMIAGPFHLEAYTPRWIDASSQWMETALIPSCELSRKLYLSMGVGPRRANVIYYGPDETKFDPARTEARDFRAEFGWPADTPLIGMVAYFYAELGANRWTPPAVHGLSVKCQSDLIMAMPAVLEEFPAAKLLLVGNGWEEAGRQYLDKMVALVEKMGLTKSVAFIGYVSDVASALKSFDVAIQASRSENLGGTIEGLLMERPMVVTRVGGLVDSVIDGETGIVVEPSDPMELARGIKALLRDPSAAQKLARQGRALMLERFTLRKTVDDENNLYRSLLAEAPRGYRRSREAVRPFAGVFVGGYIALRYRILDAWLLPAIDAGWRPWHFVTLRRWMLRITGVAFRLLSSGSKRRLAREGSKTKGVVSGQFLSSSPESVPSITPRVWLAFRMLRYRVYAVVGRWKLGWGIRAQVRSGIRRLLGGVKADE